MASFLSNAFSKLSAKSFFSITAASLVLFVMLNVRIQTVLNDENGKMLPRLQIVLELPSPFMDDSPIHDDDTEDDLNQNILLNDPKGGDLVNGTIDLQPTRESFIHLFENVPHECVMEQDCHLFISDSPHFMHKTMVVIGMVRDSEKDIIATLQQLDEVSCLFETIVFIFYESNSKDNTPFVLEDWSSMYLDGSHCDNFRYNPATNASTTSMCWKYIIIYISMYQSCIFYIYIDIQI